MLDLYPPILAYYDQLQAAKAASQPYPVAPERLYDQCTWMFAYHLGEVHDFSLSDTERRYHDAMCTVYEHFAELVEKVEP